MKKIIAVSYIIFFFCIQQAVFAEVGENFWNSYKEILKNASSANWYSTIDGEFNHSSVNYKKIKNDPDALKKTSYQRNKLEFAKAPEGEKPKLAFWINAYNFFTIVKVVENYPVASMKKIGWKKKHHNIGGNLYSLNDIEHKALRPLKDPRIHFAINCAAVGCPSLTPEIFTDSRINEQLDKVVINALKNPLHLRMINNKLNTTQLFKWFSRDFESGGYEGVADFVNRFAPERLRNVHQIEKKIKYDWNLNTEQNVLKKMKELGTKFPELKLKKK